MDIKPEYFYIIIYGGIAASIFIGIIISLVFQLKSKKAEFLNKEFILKYYNVIRDLILSTAELLKEDRVNYKTDREFHDAIASHVIDDLQRFFIEDLRVDPIFIKKIPDKLVKDIIYTVIKQLRMQINILCDSTSTEESKRNIDRPDFDSKSFEKIYKSPYEE